VGGAVPGRVGVDTATVGVAVDGAGSGAAGAAAEGQTAAGIEYRTGGEEQVGAAVDVGAGGDVDGGVIDRRLIMAGGATVAGDVSGVGRRVVFRAGAADATRLAVVAGCAAGDGVVAVIPDDAGGGVVGQHLAAGP